MASKAKPAQTKTDPIIEALQRELKQQGFYAGEIDGEAGEKTTQAKQRRDEALAAERAAKQRDRELEIEALKAQSGKTASDAEAAARTAETARQTRYNDQASSGLGMATQSGANLLAPALGTVLGMGIGSGVNYGMDKAQESRNAVLRGAAEDRMAGRTTVEGAREGVRRAGAMPPATATGRVVSRMLPQLGLGALSLGKGAQVLHDSDPEGEFYPRMADRAAGLGYIGTGAGLMKQGLRYSAAPGVAPDAQALAIINSNQLRRTPLTGTPPAADVTPAVPQVAPPDTPGQPSSPAPAPGTKAYLQQQAKDLGLKGTAKLTKSELATKLTEALSEHGGKRTVAKRVPKLPGGGGAAALAGGLAYAMTPDEAQAADGTTVGGRGEALTNAGIAGGTAYGVSKLAERLGPIASGALATGGAMMMPMAISDAVDEGAHLFTEEGLEQDAFENAHTRPEWARKVQNFLGYGDREEKYRQMAQTPERGERSGPMSQVPEPAAAAPMTPIPDAEAGYSPMVMGRLSRMQKHGASPEQIAHFLNQAVR